MSIALPPAAGIADPTAGLTEALLPMLADFGEGVLVVRHGRLVYASETAADLLALPEHADDEIAVELMLTHVEAAGRELMAARLLPLEPGEPPPGRCDLTVDHPSRGRLDLEATVRHCPMIGEAVVLLRDVTEHRLAEAALRESEAEAHKLALVASRTENAVIITDAEGRIEWVNEGFTRLTAFTPWEVMGQTPGALLQGPDTDPAMIEVMRDRVRAGEGFAAELINYRRDRSEYWAAIDVQPVVDEIGTVCCWIAVESDITDRKQTETALREANEQLVRSVRELEQRTEETRALSEMSEILQACRTVLEAYQVIGLWAGRLFPSDAGLLGILSESANMVEAVALWGQSASREPVFGPDDCWALRRGRPHLVEDTRTGLRCAHLGEADQGGASLCVPILAQGKALGVLHLRCPDLAGEPRRTGLSEAKQRLVGATVEHIALALANLRLQATLRHQSIRDPLTGLFNRRYLEETLERELRRAERNGSPVGVMVLDIDHFKRCNDTFGHEAGDVILREIGRLLQTNLRASDLACRFGGEEIVLILPDAPLTVTARRADELREAIQRLHVTHRGAALGAVSISVGVSGFPEHGSAQPALLSAADAALYQAKRSGRNRVVVAPPPTAEPA